mgnify:FL=1|tara:strand:+ start:3059 stop:3460 length:402 start_codon:yes stop_codon:yes gene_type:complete
MSNELTAHLKNLNANRQFMTLVEDLDHWAKVGVYTPLQLDWYLNLCCVVDMHKDAYGFKGSWMEMPTTDAELRTQIEEMDKEIKSLGEVIEAEIKAEEEEIEYQRQLAGEHTAAVKEALKPSASFTIGDMFPA